MIKIVVIAEVPDDRGNDWCQHIRDFDTRVPGCRFNIFAVAPDKTVEELSQMLNIKPPLPHKLTLKS